MHKNITIVQNQTSIYPFSGRIVQTTNQTQFKLKCLYTILQYTKVNFSILFVFLLLRLQCFAFQLYRFVPIL